MPEITLTLFGLFLAMLVLGFVLGWILRGGRIVREKAAINAGWKDQVDSQQLERDRLAEQNKSLMEQIGQYRASKKDSDLRARELSDALKEAFSKRDDLQRHLKEIRSELETTVAQRNKARADVDSVAQRDDASSSALEDKDRKIFKLSRELESWRNRLPPLIERFRQRDLEAQQLEIELQTAQDKLSRSHRLGADDETRIEPMDENPMADGLDASNDQYEETSEFDVGHLDKPNAADNGDSSPDEDELHNELGIDLGEADFDRVAGANETADNDDHSPDTDDDDDLANGQMNGAAVAIDRGNDPQPVPPERDNLKLIKGVGPAIEKTLNGLGFFRFRQIAEMSEYDINRVASELRGFRSRIYREDWIGQARMLQVDHPGNVPS